MVPIASISFQLKLLNENSISDLYMYEAKITTASNRIKAIIANQTHI